MCKISYVQNVIQIKDSAYPYHQDVSYNDDGFNKYFIIALKLLRTESIQGNFHIQGELLSLLVFYGLQTAALLLNAYDLDSI